ncbi:MAG: ABC transporter permease [Alphaproteobacteria bacterium]|nr:ABC transporter permease [Alphaproteobacteria bacterium]
MKTLNRRVGRVLRAERGQHLGSLLILLLSSVAFTMMSQFALNFERLVRDFEADFVQEDAAFRARGPIPDLAALEAEAGAVIEATPAVDCALPDGQTLHLTAPTRRVNRHAVVAGADLSGPDELLLNPTFAAANRIAVGDTLTVCGKPLDVVGLVALPQFIYPVQSPNDMMPSPGWGVGVAQADALAALGPTVGTTWAVKFDPSDVPVRPRAVQLKRLLERRGVEVTAWTNIEDNRRVNIVDAEVRILKIVSVGVPTGMLLLACVMVASVLRRMIARETPILGALVALGVRRREIIAHYLRIPLLLAGVGSVAGAGLGLLGVKPYLAFFATVFTVPLTGVALDGGRMAVNLLLPVVFLAASAALVLHQTLRRPPAELMKGQREGAAINPLERSLRLERLGFRARFMVRQQLRSPSRFALLVLGVAIATVLVQWGFSLKTSMDYLITGTTEVYPFEYEYNFAAPRTAPLPGDATPFNAALFLPPGEETRDFYVTGIPPDTERVVLRDADGRRLRVDRVIATRALARMLDIEPGDAVEMVGKLDGRRYTLTVDAVADTFAGTFIFLPLDRFNALMGMPEGSYVGAFSDAPIPLPEGVDHTVTSLQAKAEGARALLGMVYAMGTVVALTAFGVGLIVIYVVTALLVEESRPTISLMKVLGYRPEEIDRLVLRSSTIPVVLGYVIGLPLTVAAMGVLIATLEQRVGLVVPQLRIGPGYAVGGFVVVMLAYGASLRLSRRRVAAIPMHEALKAE